jgi:hypothetical protein
MGGGNFALKAVLGLSGVAVLGHESTPDMKQQDKMRELYARFSGDEDRCVREYAEAERRGEVSRKSDTSGRTPESYAKALFKDGIQKGWLKRDGETGGKGMRNEEVGVTRDKTFRGNASQFFIAGELCRRGHAAVVTLGNTPNVDILCSNASGTRFAHIQVKTFEPGNRTCSVGLKALKEFGPTFFWVLGGIPSVGVSTWFRVLRDSFA